MQHHVPFYEKAYPRFPLIRFEFVVMGIEGRFKLAVLVFERRQMLYNGNEEEERKGFKRGYIRLRNLMPKCKEEEERFKREGDSFIIITLISDELDK